MPRRRVRSMAVVLAACVGCHQGEPTSPTLLQRVVVHAVLDPQRSEQVILVERTTGSTDQVVGGSPANAMDPIVSSGGVPISGARVVVYGPGADSCIAVEDRSLRTDGTGGGVYRIPSAAAASADGNSGVLRLVPGGTYHLRIATPIGVVSGTTHLPQFTLTVNRASRVFNLDTDSLRLPTFVGNRLAAGHLLRHVLYGVSSTETLRADSTTVLLAPAPLTDNRTWSFAFSRPNIRPGVPQRFVVVAVDSNYLDYVRSGYDPFGHDAKGNRLTGGVGLFGAVASLVDANLDLVADRDHAIEGDWSTSVGGVALPVSLRLRESLRWPVRSNGHALVGNRAHAER
ncbi:MAG: hypothetical protein U0163_20425 [Gemmatimonadaceae bacterium]